MLSEFLGPPQSPASIGKHFFDMEATAIACWARLRTMSRSDLARRVLRRFGKGPNRLMAEGVSAASLIKSGA